MMRIRRKMGRKRMRIIGRTILVIMMIKRMIGKKMLVEIMI